MCLHAMHSENITILPLLLLFSMLNRKLSQSAVIVLSSVDIFSVFPVLYVVLPTRQAARFISNKTDHFSATPKATFLSCYNSTPIKYFSQNLVFIFCFSSQIVIQRLVV